MNAAPKEAMQDQWVVHDEAKPAVARRRRPWQAQDMFTETFSTTRLTLRPVALVDAEPIYNAYAQDPDVTRFLTWRPHVRIEETQTHIASCMVASSSRAYVLVQRNSDKLVGMLDLRQSSPWRLDFGYVLAKSSWGQGLMTEALTAVTDWALAQPGIWRIGGVCDVENLASARVMEKAGFTCEGLLRQWSMHPNISDEPRDCFSFAKSGHPPPEQRVFPSYFVTKSTNFASIPLSARNLDRQAAFLRDNTM